MKSSENGSNKTAISRRSFIKKSGAVAAVAGAGLISWQSGLLDSIFGGRRNRTGSSNAMALRWSSSRFVAMGTFLDITVPKDGDPAAMRKAVSAVREVENSLSYFMPSSEVGRFNRNASEGSTITLSKDFASVLQAGRKINQASGGAFDPTVVPLLVAWGFRDNGSASGRLPSDRELQAAMDRTGMNHLLFAGDNRTLSVDRDGVKLDLGGIGKGYGMDRAAMALAAAGVNGMVNGGGDIATVGWAEADEPWAIGVRDPLRPGRIFATLQLPGGQAVATSGNYEQFRELNGQRISHIIDPRTGAPADRVVSATVLAGKAVDADAIATACTAMSPMEAVDMCNRLPGVEALLVYKTNNSSKLSVTRTDGMDLKIHYQV